MSPPRLSRYLSRVLLPEIVSLSIMGLVILIVDSAELTRTKAWFYGLLIAALSQLYAAYYTFQITLNGDQLRDQQVLAKIARGHFGKFAIVAAGSAMVLASSSAIRADHLAALCLFSALFLAIILHLLLSARLNKR